MVNGDLTRYPEVGCPWGARTGEPRAKAGARYCEPGWGPTIIKSLRFFLNFFKALGIIKNVSLALGQQNLLTFPYPDHCSHIFIISFIHVFSLVLFL